MEALKRVIVLGGCGFIGSNMVNALTERNYDCIVLDNKVEGHPLAFTNFHVDIRNRTELETAITTIFEEFGPIEGTIFASGISRAGHLLDQDFEEFLEVIDVNFLSVAYATKYMLPNYIKQGHGKLLFVASVFATIVAPEMIAYNSSKAALLQFAKSITEDFASSHIISNVISPGFIYSPMVDDVLNQVGKNPKWMHLLAGLPKKYIDLDTVIHTMLYLFEQNNSVNGANFILDGGYSIR
ncbi:SDR family NAD(P)-dependent oxidoreductase [Paenibacillus crassostreae]|uniref:Short-chain dehydrogenase n=1 Tax=Paenibacillus crassostreae TaxID=1763538 RepID=A0A167FB07_9BACL|nr:SDR family oxidoreductase [Paenibacillus crassostreae]AOZ90866.1 hypothetical protein LPB68_00695 [Paenibacillus crassostreae]OAB76367.1 hypothetical protein PNBC_02840 [Paenibacillus crassostreae]